MHAQGLQRSLSSVNGPMGHALDLPQQVRSFVSSGVRISSSPSSLAAAVDVRSCSPPHQHSAGERAAAGSLRSAMPPKSMLFEPTS